MAKKKTEPKFRWLKVAVSNETYANIEATAKRNKITRSKVIAECTDRLKDSPLDFMNLRVENINRQQVRRELNKRITDMGTRNALNIRKGDNRNGEIK